MPLPGQCQGKPFKADRDNGGSAPSVLDRPLHLRRGRAANLTIARARLKLRPRLQRPADRSLLRYVAQAIDRDALLHCRTSRSSRESELTGASSGSDSSSGPSAQDDRTRCAKALKRATTCSSSAESGRVTFRNLISGVPHFNPPPRRRCRLRDIR